MSTDAEVLRLLRQASIDYTALQLRLLHDYKRWVAEAVAPVAQQSVLQPANGKAGEAPGRPRTNLSDVLFESTRYSIATYAHWLQLQNKQLDFLADMLRGPSRHGPEGLGFGDLQIQVAGQAGERVKASFNVANPFPFKAQVGFSTVTLRRDGEEKRSLAAAEFARTSDPKDDVGVGAGERAAFEMTLALDAALAPGRYLAQTTVLLDTRPAGTLLVSLDVNASAASSSESAPPPGLSTSLAGTAPGGPPPAGPLSYPSRPPAVGAPSARKAAKKAVKTPVKKAVAARAAARKPAAKGSGAKKGKTTRGRP
jgi:hypothetical protein